ncbi:PAS domain-containing sensor histidine kinase [Dyadobacter alkalitolerans]|uniref:PAS domain-containing sensor histidine kinase n=1 Tax=Dyadobacter alkalitolerans TaxID=492736 RepID=UPI0004256CC0|nr:ATP-binding protein [Dyadobacter alkalitolerans]
MGQAEHILQDLPCGCVVFDGVGTITFANRTLCLMLNYEPEAILGQSIEKILTISSRIFHQTHFFPLLKLNGTVSEIFLTLKPLTGSSIPVMVNAKIQHESDPICYVCVFVSVWERRKYEEQLLEMNRVQQKALDENALLNRLKDELESNQFALDRKISILSERSQEYLQMGKIFMHDMQEPVRKISLFFDTFMRKANIPENTDDLRHLAVIRKSIMRLRFMLGSMLDFVQVSNAADPMTLLKPAELITEAREQLLTEQNLADLDIRIGELPEFDGRKTQIKRVFYELLKNAVESKGPNRELIVQVTAIISEENIYRNHLSKYKYADHIKIEFTDNGIGFDSRFDDYVFGLLNKLNAGSPGLGVGLALCKQIISSHYGTMKVKSRVGEGTSIIIILPLRQIPEYTN